MKRDQEAVSGTQKSKSPGLLTEGLQSSDHGCNERELGQTPGDVVRTGRSERACSPWGPQSDVTGQLSTTATTELHRTRPQGEVLGELVGVTDRLLSRLEDRVAVMNPGHNPGFYLPAVSPRAATELTEPQLHQL